jgi:hypothetical protein
MRHGGSVLIFMRFCASCKQPHASQKNLFSHDSISVELRAGGEGGKRGQGCVRRGRLMCPAPSALLATPAAPRSGPARRPGRAAAPQPPSHTHPT